MLPHFKTHMRRHQICKVTRWAAAAIMEAASTNDARQDVPSSLQLPRPPFCVKRIPYLSKSFVRTCATLHTCKRASK